MPTSTFRQAVHVLDLVEDYAIQNGAFTVLDVACGNGRYGALIKESWPQAHVTGVDAVPENLIWDKGYDRVERGYLPNGMGFFGRFDVVLFLDIVEHLEYEDALRALTWCRKHGPTIVATPNGFMPQGGDTFDRHRSGWTVEAFEEMGAGNLAVVPGRLRTPCPQSPGQIVCRLDPLC